MDQAPGAGSGQRQEGAFDVHAGKRLGQVERACHLEAGRRVRGQIQAYPHRRLPQPRPDDAGDAGGAVSEGSAHVFQPGRNSAPGQLRIDQVEAAADCDRIVGVQRYRQLQPGLLPAAQLQLRIGGQLFGGVRQLAEQIGQLRPGKIDVAGYVQGCRHRLHVVDCRRHPACRGAGHLCPGDADVQARAFDPDASGPVGQRRIAVQVGEGCAGELDGQQELAGRILVPGKGERIAGYDQGAYQRACRAQVLAQEGQQIIPEIIGQQLRCGREVHGRRVGGKADGQSLLAAGGNHLSGEGAFGTSGAQVGEFAAPVVAGELEAAAGGSPVQNQRRAEDVAGNLRLEFAGAQLPEAGGLFAVDVHGCLRLDACMSDPGAVLVRAQGEVVTLAGEDYPVLAVVAGASPGLDVCTGGLRRPAEDVHDEVERFGLGVQVPVGAQPVALVNGQVGAQVEIGAVHRQDVALALAVGKGADVDVFECNVLPVRAAQHQHGVVQDQPERRQLAPDRQHSGQIEHPGRVAGEVGQGYVAVLVHGQRQHGSGHEDVRDYVAEVKQDAGAVRGQGAACRRRARPSVWGRSPSGIFPTSRC